ncbi:hypothetical protein CHS0354_036407 [Potamilus streckersoni]|uniref:Uncharacterized protein n=1 Tax=Potamilus streckersoni TaxID=2493646 RepID=A0AAE0SWL0_9BIVA|nr:hypothetical protein CHS0354_036407 [Potamilus streckersoni]
MLAFDILLFGMSHKKGMRSGSYAIIVFLLCTTVAIATANTFIYSQGSKFNSQSINGGNLRNMMNLKNILVGMKNARILPLMRMQVGMGRMIGKGPNSVSQGSAIGGGNGLGSGFSSLQNGYGIRMGSVGGRNGLSLAINRIQNGFGIGMGSGYGRMNRMTGGMSGGPQGTSFSTSYLPGGNANTVPKMNGFGGGLSLIQNGFGSGMGFGYGRTNRMTGGMSGGPQGTSVSTSYLLSGNGNTIPKMNGLGGGVNRIENGLGNGVGSGYESMNKMAGGMPGGSQLPSYGMSFLSSGGNIGSAGLGTTFGTSLGNIGANMVMSQNTGIGHSSSGNQGIGGIVPYGYSPIDNGSPWGFNDDIFDNFGDSDDLGVDFASDFDDIFDR